MEIKKNLIPNSTQIPNLILDLVIPLITEAEVRCLLYICRRTFGFHKKYDSISLSQFEHGIRSRQGGQLDLGTGMSRPAVTLALKNLVKAEVIFMRKNSRGNRYMLNLHMDVDKVVNQVNPQNLGNPGKPSLTKNSDPPVDNRPEFLRLRVGLTEKLSLKTTN